MVTGKPETPDVLDRLEQVFSALADRTRLRILGLLSGGEVCVCEIHETLQLPQPTISRHLAYLRNAGLVSGRKDGLWVYYSLASPPDALVKTILDSAAHWVHHAPSAERDSARLEKRTGSARPRATLKLKVLGCCGRSN